MCIYVYKTEEGYLCAGYIFLDLFAREVFDFFFTKNQRTTVSNIYIGTYVCIYVLLYMMTMLCIQHTSICHHE